MKVICCCVLLGAVSFAALADESCGIQVAKLLSTGKVAALAELFQGKADLALDLQHLVGTVGSLSSVEQVSGPRFKQHVRRSVGAMASEHTVLYEGSWVNATSEKLGAIQLHVAKAPDSKCSLLTLHVDSIL
jgi:hypothetical protein